MQRGDISPISSRKDGAAVGGFKDARSLCACVGKRAFFVAEEFAFEEGFGDCAAVDDEKGLVAARALPVDGFGDEVFPGAAFARDEDADGGGRDLGHAFADFVAWGPERPRILVSGRVRFCVRGVLQFREDEWIGEQGIGV